MAGETSSAPPDPSSRSPEPLRAPLGGRLRGALVCVLVLALLAAGALLVNLWWGAAGGGSGQPEQPPGGGSARPMVQPAPAPQAGPVAGELLAGTGLHELSAAPGGVVAPPRAEPLFGRTLRMGRSVWTEARLVCPGPRQAVAEHYRRAAEAAGFRPAGEAQDAGGAQRLHFTRGHGVLMVVLPKPPPDAKMVRGTVQYIRPDADAAPGRKER